MAISETIKHAMEALEAECAHASTIAETIIAAAGEQGSAEPPWVSMHHHAIRQLVEHADALVYAINRGTA